MSNWWLLLGMTVITYSNRYAFFAKRLHYTPGERVQRLLSYSTFAILTAIWSPIMFNFEFDAGFSHAGWDYIAGATLAGVLSMLKVPSIVVVLISASVFFGLRVFL